MKLLTTPLTDKVAFDKFLSIFGSGTIWLKTGHSDFWKGKTELDKCTVFKTKKTDKGDRVSTGSEYDAYSKLRKISEYTPPGVFFIPGRPSEAPLKEYHTGSNLVSCEMDDGSTEEQLARIGWFSEISGLDWALVIGSGGKSKHPHLKASEWLDREQRLYLQKLLNMVMRSDPAVNNPHQPMRIPGFYRKENEKEQTLDYYSNSANSYEQLLEGISKVFDSLDWKLPESEQLTREGEGTALWGEAQRVLKRKPLKGFDYSQLTDDDVISIIKDLLDKPSDYFDKLHKPADPTPPEEVEEIKQRLKPIISNPGKGIVDLFDCLYPYYQDLIRSGVGAGGAGRDPEGFKLSCHIQQVEEILYKNSINYSGDGRSLLDEYCARCTPALSRRDADKLWGRYSRYGNRYQLDEGILLKKVAKLLGISIPRCKGEIDIPISREQWKEKYGQKNNVVGFGRKDKQHKTSLDYLVEKIQKKLNSCSLTPDILLNCDTPPDDLYDKIPLEAITLLEAYKGWGKSQKVIRKLTDKLRNLGYSVLFLCPRIILGLEMAEKMMATYQDDLPQTAEALKKYNAAVVIYDSLWKFINKNWDYIIMDEARAGLKHLTTANTAVRDRRPLILSRLKEIIKNAKGILLADADPTDTEVEYIQKLAPEKQTFYIKNEALPPSREIELIIGGKKDRESVINQLHYDAEKLNDDLCTAIGVVKFEHPGLAEGSEHFKRLVWDKLQEIGAEPLLITADSQIELQGIVEAIIKKFPLLGEYVVRLDRTTTEEPWAKELIKNLDGGFKAQCTLVWGWSPSLMVGVSQQMEWFKKGYCFYFGTIEPCEFRQQMLRSRPCRKWVGWAATHNNLKSGISSSFDPDERKQTYIKNYQDTTSNQSLMHLALDLAIEEARKEEREMSPEEIWEYIGNFNKENYLDNPHIDLTAKIEARSDYLRFNCGENLKHELETKENFVVRPLKEGSNSDLPGLTGEEKEAIKLVEAELMYQGSLMSEDDALAIADSKLDNDQKKLAGYKIAKGLPGTNVSTDFFLEYLVKDRHWRQKQFLHFLAIHPSIAFMLEARAIADHTYKWIFGESFLPDLKLNLRKGELLQKIGFIKDRKLTLAGASYNKDSQTVIDIFTKAKKFEQQIKRFFNLSVGEEPIKFIGALLDKLGKSHSSKRGTNNIRNYEIKTLQKVEARIKSITGDDEKSITKLEGLTELRQNLLYQETIQQSLIQRYWEDMAIEEKPIYGDFEYTTDHECSTENSPPHQAYLYKDNRGDVEVTKTIGNNELEVCGGYKVKQQKNEQKTMPPHELDNTNIDTLPETPDLLTEDFNEEHKFIGIGRLLSYFSPTGEVIGRYLGKIKNSVDEILVEFGGGVREIVSPRYCLAVKATPEQPLKDFRLTLGDDIDFSLNGRSYGMAEVIEIAGSTVKALWPGWGSDREIIETSINLITKVWRMGADGLEPVWRAAPDPIPF